MFETNINSQVDWDLQRMGQLSSEFWTLVRSRGDVPGWTRGAHNHLGCPKDLLCRPVT